MTASNPAVVFDDVSFSWPDGTPVLRGIDATLGVGRTGLIGANGTGKSTLLRLIAGELTPTVGQITAAGQVSHLPQRLTLRTGATVAELMGVRQRLDALRAIEAGDADQRHFDALGDDWDVEARVRAALDEAGLGGIGPDRTVGTLSGGEAMLVALAGLRSERTPIVLLDEPTNNLDRQARHRLYDTITAWSGTIVVVSHDVALLELLDATAELHTGSLRTFGGAYSAYRAHVEEEQEAAQRALRVAQQELTAARRRRTAAETTLAHRRRTARTAAREKRVPKIIANQRRSQAQASAGRLRDDLSEKVDAALEAVTETEARIRDDDGIRILLPDPAVPARRRLAELCDDRGMTVEVRGSERLALTGRNGIGKTRLLDQLISGERPPDARVDAIAHTERIGHLPQRLDHLDDEATLLEMVTRAAPSTPIGKLRADLARFLFRAESVHRQVGELSGGERFRVALASILLADPPNQLLVLDEPTNDLDLWSIDQLVDALDGYRGGLIVVSHDDAFLSRLRIDTCVELTTGGLEVLHR